MEPLTAAEIRASFLNCSKGEAKRAVLPDLDEVPWSDLDFLGWADPSGSSRAYLVVPREEGLIGLLLRQNPAGKGTARRSKLCEICLTAHTDTGVCLTVAAKTGPAGKRGDTTGIHICRDLGCSLYARGKKASGVPRLRETLPIEAMVERVQVHLDGFVRRVLAG
ncbi:FBP domain-containing protein [Nocardioides sp. JQ2195]|uniref:FBP domain-containing protein n=1 Tax=Nocardioides sp. JQ2195 TaxID=2592334 RepID=UPI00143EB7A2|nr:FBP domain-containing protein [Nocardioides sp. JQ2195]QIX25277.1 FBP domain-containing protein [Nocardioides sp. JQ2195]